MDISRSKEYTNVLHWGPKECGGSYKKTLLPVEFSDLGLLFWKAIEIAYVMRPKEEIRTELCRLLSMYRWTSPRVAVHVRRGDKHRGDGIMMVDQIHQFLLKQTSFRSPVTSKQLQNTLKDPKMGKTRE